VLPELLTGVAGVFLVEFCRRWQLSCRGTSRTDVSGHG
jgi:hypothetical protein